VTATTVDTGSGDLRLYTVADVTRLLRISRTRLYDLIRDGRIRTVNEGRSRRITAAAIRDYIALLEREAEGNE
jgi:excisionase family DNA binding protein